MKVLKQKTLLMIFGEHMQDKLGVSTCFLVLFTVEPLIMDS